MDFADGNMTLSIWYTTEGLYTNWQTIAGKGEGNGWRLARSGGSGSNVTFSSRKPYNIPAALNDQTVVFLWLKGSKVNADFDTRELTM